MADFDLDFLEGPRETKGVVVDVGKEYVMAMGSPTAKGNAVQAGERVKLGSIFITMGGQVSLGFRTDKGLNFSFPAVMAQMLLMEENEEEEMIPPFP